MKKTSLVEKVFQEIFGYLPKKSGVAYERLSAIAVYLLESGDVIHDNKMRGSFSNTLYQLDVCSKNHDSISMGEAKDYTKKGKKVGRGDLQKLGGALLDLQKIERGAFFSATGYTKPAKSYALASKNIINGKKIDLFELRPSTILDEKGFVKTVIIGLHLKIAHPQKGIFMPLLTSEAKKKIIPPGQAELHFQMDLQYFYDSTGKIIISSLEELTSTGYGDVDTTTNYAHGCYILKGYHVFINDTLVEIDGLEYKVPFTFEDREIKITDDSKNRFVILDTEGNILKIISDELLKQFSFDDAGKLYSTNF